MIIFFSEGGLGNQLFQYAFLKTIAGDERILAYGFSNLLEVFNGCDIIVINRGKIFFTRPLKYIPKIRFLYYLPDKIAYNILKPVIYKLCDGGFLSCISINYEKIDSFIREDTTYSFKEGKIKGITVVKTSFFQSEKFFNPKVLNSLEIKRKFVSEAEKFISNFSKKYKVFVHIRFGDYKNFKIYGKEVIPPISYYEKCIRWFNENRKNVIFIFLSDEPDRVKKTFGKVENKVISKNYYAVDFAIMTLCQGGILSPSSFSWWGSYFMRERDIVFAPKHWLGFASKIDYPKEPLAKFMIPVDVD